ncbi:glycosyltransferase family 4 protein [Marinobacter daepoensis]|uniref:glycosyltransferase family 4 protein n=1 Tax=Marinobacter daepoensis TaxID=262077 RepID=UPI001C95CBF0|nr:glycosyltransferase family 4 protein [Marinobacter daepoensis]MBY6032306.1 glycosyltransferase family 4 protein [Marinobacter daepoensis]
MTPISTTLVVPRYWPAQGGSEMHAQQLVQSLAESGHRPRVLCHSTSDSTSLELAFANQQPRTISTDEPYEVTRACPGGFQRFILRQLAKRHATCRWVRPVFDVIARNFCQKTLIRHSAEAQVIHSIYNGLTCSAESSLMAARRLGIPFVWTPLACTSLPAGTAWSSSRFVNLYAQADAIVALTEHERAWLIKWGAAPRKTFVCPMGPIVTSPSEPEAFRARHGLKNKPTVLFLGRHDENKGFQRVIATMPLVWQTCPDTQFLFVGPQTAHSRRLFSAINDSRVTVVEKMSQPDKNAALATCDFLCVPSTLESLGVVYLEAWHYAKPVVALDIPLLQSLIDHGQDGWLLPDSAPALARAIVGLLHDPEKTHRMGLVGRQKVDHTFNWDAIAERYAQIYQYALDHTATQPR